MWIGTWKGLNRLDQQTGEVEQIVADPKKDGSLPAGLITSLLVDRTGRLWVGSIGGGIAIGGVVVASRRPGKAAAPEERSAEPVADVSQNAST